MLSTNQFSELVFSWITFSVFVKNTYTLRFIRELICFCLVSAVSTLFPLIQQTLLHWRSGCPWCKLCNFQLYTDFLCFVRLCVFLLDIQSTWCIIQSLFNISLSSCLCLILWQIHSQCWGYFISFQPINVYTAITPALYHVFIFIPPQCL